MKQTNRIPASVRRHFTDHKASGLSITAYCKEHDICPSTFYGWNKRYKDKLLLDNVSTPSRSFIEIPIHKKSHSSPSRIRITRTEIEFPPEKADHIVEALKTLLPPRADTHQ